MYSNAAGIIPVIETLLVKGAALGTVLAFMMATIGLSLPEGIILRKVGAYGFPSALRMTIGSENDNRRTIAALANYLKGAA